MRQFFPILFLILILGIFVAANIYLSKRFNFFFGIENTKILYFVFPALTLFMMFGMMPLSNTINGFGSLVYKSAAITMGFLLFLLLSVLIIDLFGLFITLTPKIKGILAIVLPLTLSITGIWNAANTKVKEVNIPLNDLKTEIKAVQLTDIHIGHFWGTKTLDKIVAKTNALNPEVVFITGDLFDGRIRLSDESFEPLTKLNAPVYFVEGNHDGYTGAKEIKQKLRESGIKVLENEVAQFKDLQIIGLNHMLADSSSVNMHATGVRATIQSTLENLNISAEKAAVLLHHSPDGIKYANKHGVDLYLAGHTHAGQLFPINLIAKLMFDYNKGLHDFMGTKMYVSQGSGTFGPPMRIGTSSEITLLNLKPQ